MAPAATTSPILFLAAAVDPVTGMLINISEIKGARRRKLSHDRFDHKFLNEDNPAFAMCRRPPRTSRDNFTSMLHLYFPMSMPNWPLVISPNRRNEARLIMLMARAKEITGSNFLPRDKPCRRISAKRRTSDSSAMPPPFTVIIIGRV